MFKPTLAATLALAALAAAGCSSSAPAREDLGSLEQHAYGRFSDRWPTNTINVCWDTAGFPTEKALVESTIIGYWGPGLPASLHTPAVFQHWGDCTPGEDGIHITIDGSRSRSYVGHAQPGYGAQMWLNFTFPDPAFWHNECTVNDATRMLCIGNIAIHEFGHALGLRHEQDRPDTQCNDEPDPGILDGDAMLGPFDAQSVMNYCGWQANGIRPPSYGDIDAVNLLFGAPPPASSVEMDLSFEASNYPGFFIQGVGALGGTGEMLEVRSPSDMQRATFHVVPGLADSSYASFESTTQRGWYLRADSTGRIVLAANDGTLPMRQDASFRLGHGLNDASGYSFELYGRAGWFMRHANGHLWVSKNDGSSLLAQDATFKVRSPQTLVSLRSSNFPSYYLRHAYGLGEMSIPTSSLDDSDGTFRERPGLADGHAVSFESRNFPGYFLRHQYGRVKLMQPSASDTTFNSDATFWKRPALDAAGNDTSFESYNFPGAYMRHRDGHVYVEYSTSNPATFNADASFYVVGPLAP